MTHITHFPSLGKLKYLGYIYIIHISQVCCLNYIEVNVKLVSILIIQYSIKIRLHNTILS